MVGIMNQPEVTKHSAIIQIENKITLFQRRGWNILLSQAFHNLKTQRVHKMRFTEFCEMMGYVHTDKKYREIEELLYALTGIGIRWNFLGKDKHEKERGGVRLLAGFKIVDGMCMWDYSEFLIEKLADPRIYARISISIQNRFKSKHSLALYELFIDYKGVKQTPWIPIEDFRGLMGISVDEYPRYKDLKYYVINRSLRDINKESDLNVILDTRRNNRKVSELKFHISEKQDFQPSFFIPAPPIPEELKELEEHSSTVNQELLDDLIKFGVPAGKAKRELKKDEQRVRQALDAAIAYIESQGDNIHNIAGVVNRAITDGWTYKSQHEIEKEEKKKAQIQARTEKEKKERALEEKQKRFEEQRKEEAFRIFNAMSEQEKEIVLAEVEKRVPSIFRKSSFKEKGINSPMVMFGTFIPYMAKNHLPPEFQKFENWVDR
jgi:hypothetical protein